MIKFYCALSTLLMLTRDRVQQRFEQDRNDDGLGVLELVVLALGLFVLAVAVVAGITAAVNNRLNQIQ